jgi:hypothetical protein
MQEVNLVQVTLECPDLDFPIRLPFMQMNQLTSELLLSEIMLSRYHMYLISYQESLKRFNIFDSALM